MIDASSVHPLLERAQLLADELDDSHRGDAQRLIAACKRAFAMELSDEVELSGLKRELRALAELLARRGARAMPLGALGRAALARLAGADADARFLLAECEEKMALFG